MQDKAYKNTEQYSLIKLPDGRIVNVKTENLPGSSLKTHEIRDSQQVDSGLK
jgi:hypothetical protein